MEFSTESKIAAKILVYGSQNWMGEEFLKLLKSRNIDFVAGNTIPGQDTDVIVTQELLDEVPSHVVLLFSVVDLNPGKFDFELKNC